MKRVVFYPLLVVAALSVVGAGYGLRRFLKTLPAYDQFEEYKPSLTTRVFGRHGEPIAEFSLEKRALLPLSQIPVDLQNAVLAIEDSRFFEHWGVSPRGIMRSAVVNLMAGRVVQGGSTLTQQLAKLVFLSPERKIVRKIKEILLAVQMERGLSKEEIFQYYLNQIYFGHGAYGVQAAASIYYGKKLTELSLAESALLAGMIKYPGGYSPFNHPGRAERRRMLVLKRMKDEGFISVEEMKEALAEPIPMERPSRGDKRAQHFVEYVRRQLEPKYGTSTLWRGGMKIHTTIDMNMQAIAEEEMEAALAEFDEKARVDWERRLEEDLEAGIEPLTVSTSPPANIQGAFMILDVKSGAVRAMIGGRHGGARAGLNRVTQSKRQPGSTFKPFVWAAGLQQGLTGTSLVEDSPLAYYYDGRDWRLLEGTTDQYAVNLATAVFYDSNAFKPWVPNNYDGKFLGVITLRKALALSRNVVSVRLIQHIGPPKVVELAHRAGIRSWLSPVLALGLGASTVTPLELASAYQSFANGGIHVEPYAVVSVQNQRGKELERYVPTEEEAFSPQTAYLTTHLMKVVIEGGTGRRARVLRRPLAGKTGTSNRNRDLWFVGFTPDLLAIAWMGYDDDTSLGRRLGSSGTVVPWWTKIMKRVFKDYPKRDFPVPEDMVFMQVDPERGCLALPMSEKVVLQAYLKGTEPTEYCAYDDEEEELSPDILITNQVDGDSVGAEEAQAEAQLEDEAGGESGGLPELPSDEELEALAEMEFAPEIAGE